VRLGPNGVEASARNSGWSMHAAAPHVQAHDFNRGGSMDGVNVFGVIIWNVNAIGLTPNPSPKERGTSQPMP
jgi:hypothetical protein